ncbi:hypothetical protein DVH24_039355 [Malus domestica]|uniref:Uncharacterized protein n=1 Tax=Malus domestica TaxID=3750 RepID=A0A498HW32_MALDO|nr:hypothetical protein DVH24_039355 [Malus domestica]
MTTRMKSLATLSSIRQTSWLGNKPHFSRLRSPTLKRKIGMNYFKVKLQKHKLKQRLYEDSVSWFKVSKELEMKKKKVYEGGVELFQAYAILHSGSKANKDWLNVDVTDKRNLLYRLLF